MHSIYRLNSRRIRRKVDYSILSYMILTNSPGIDFICMFLDCL